jgi:predicted permease
MAALRRLIGGLNALFRHRRVEQELDEELRAYLETSIEEKTRAGMAREDAIRAARVEMGSLEAVKDHTRDVGWEARLESVWWDVRYALRMLRRSPGFTAVAILTLALAIGANTAIFSVVNAVLLRPLPFAEPDRLLTTRGSLADLRDLQAANRSFADIAFWASNQFNLRLDGDSRQVLGGQVTRNLLPLLGVEPLLGRNFTEEDDRQDTVILGYAIWQSRFGGDPGVLGRRVDMSGTTYTVIGVAPPWFRFPTAAFQLWAPLSSLDRGAPQQAKNRAFRIFSAVARLKPGVTPQQAQTDAQALSSRLAQEFPSTNEGVTFELQPLYQRLVGDARPMLTILLGIVGLLLLIACANVANLMLARTTVREREMAIRVALGAGRARLIRQLMTESVTLAAAGGVLGLLVTMWGLHLLPLVLEARVPRADGIRIDGGVLAFSACATILTGIFFGLAPAWQAASGPAGSLKESGRSVAGSGRGRRLRRAIVVVQTALAVILLVGAGLLVRSFVALTSRDAGFVPANLLSFNVQFVSLPNDAARAQAMDLLIDRLTHLPGVEAAGGATGFPPVTPQRGTRFAVEGRTLTAGEDGAYFIAASPRYFATLRTPVLQGRAIELRDTAGAELIVAINRTLARQLFLNEDAVGRRIKLLNPEQSADWRTIVGVVGDVKYRGLDEESQPTVYTPFAQTPFMWIYVMVRTIGDVEPMMRTLRTVVPSVNPTLIAANIRPMEEVLSESVAVPRFNMLLVSAFAILALLLSAIGIYGVIAYSVTQRTHEIGVRMALGAARVDVLRLVLSEGIATAAAGVALGLAGAAAITGVMTTLLFGITARDPLTFGAGAALLLAVAVLASYIPALRAMHVEPVTALRAE